MRHFEAARPFQAGRPGSCLDDNFGQADRLLVRLSDTLQQRQAGGGDGQ